ncbi:MAG: TonB-dependent receptor [Alphaproteobacteria bacterium]|nr:TonB-dependent receptor [Alphaproteobacteria bacterium]
MTQKSAATLMACASLLALACAFAPVPAFAQTGTPSASGVGVAGMGEVIVTARKKEESAKDVPSSVTALSGATLEAVSAGGADISFLSARVPSVNVESSFGRTFPRFYIRGLGNTDFDLNASQPVSLVYDDVVFENPVLKGFPAFDVERVEVLRGPQGTLFGRNTPAGVVKFDSVKPTEQFDAKVRAGYRTFNGFDFEGAVGGKIADGLSARASLLVQTQDAWIDNGFTGQKDFTGDYRDIAGRLQLRYQPNAQLDALLNVHGRTFDGTSQIFRANVITRGTTGLNANFDRDKVFYDGGAGNNQSLDTYGVTGRVTYDFGDVVMTSVTGYEHVEFFGRGDIDGGAGAAFLPTGSRPGLIPFPAQTADGIDGLDQWSQELRFASDGSGPFSWLGGLYYFNEDVTISSYDYDTFAPGQPQDGFAQQNQKTEAWALFGSASYKATDKLTLTAGLRYSDDNKDFRGRRTQSPFGAPNITRAVSVGDSAVSWDVSAVYALSDTTNVYGRIARGFRAPSIQGRILFGDDVTTANSEFLTSYEAGVKGSAFERRLLADVSVYTYTIDDQQLTAVGGGQNFNRLVNAKEGRGYGFEADLRARPTENLTLSAAFGYNNTEIKDPALGTQPCGAPCTVTNPVVGGIVRINGNSFPNAPEWTGSLTAEYVYPLASGARLFAFTDWAYKGDTNFFLYESKEFREDGYWEGGLRVGYETADAKKQIALYGRNITDEERLVGGIDFNNLTGFVNNPRIWGIEASLKY